MQRTILIVDDSELNRTLLQQMLGTTYAILTAENGRQALNLLIEEHERVSVILLDLIMPEMDGYEVLACLRQNPAFAQIPVIVTTGSTDGTAEGKAFALGAHEYVTKPYDPEIIQHRIKNTIRLRETSIDANLARKDRLTGLYNREYFFDKVADRVQGQPAGTYLLGYLDIDDFKLINDQHGSAVGDSVLKQVATILMDGFQPHHGICCRISADHFAVLYPCSLLQSEVLEDIHNRLSLLDGTLLPLTFRIGRYRVTDPSLPTSAMYDRAVMAERTIRGRFDVRIVEYREEMRAELLRVQRVTSEMGTALAEGRFEAWLQPQFNHATKACIGAEALARWRHPKRGIIPPNSFIPIFEQNGFIYEMDKEIWRQVCVMLRTWLDAGRDPLPISVNISRYDIARDDFFETLTGLVKQFQVPVELLRLEVTESAFASSAEDIIVMIQKLVDFGFTVELDDFGSGYSSLNTLKDVPAHILKLDMRFLAGKQQTRGGNIIESTVRMAKWLGMPVIAEGVETTEQADYLKSIGCSYLQGYLYAKPVPMAEYEKLFTQSPAERTLDTLKTVGEMDNNSFWNPISQETLIFNSYVGGACIFEYRNGKTEIIRANDKYLAELGKEQSTAVTIERLLAVNPENFMDVQSYKLFRTRIREAIETNAETTCDICLPSLPFGCHITYIHTNLRVIAHTGDRYLFYCTIVNITATVNAERRERESTAHLQYLNQSLHEMMDDMPGGFVRLHLCAKQLQEPVYINEGFCRMVKRSREECFSRYLEDPMCDVHPDDKDAVRAFLRILEVVGSGKTDGYRLMTGEGTIIWVKVTARQSANDTKERFWNLFFEEIAPPDSELSPQVNN